MERSLQKLGKSPEEAKKTADRIKAKTKKARSSGGSEPDLSPVRKDALSDQQREQLEGKMLDLEDELKFCKRGSKKELDLEDELGEVRERLGLR